MSEQVDDWCRRANELAETMLSAAREYKSFAETYEEMRNIGPSRSNSNKTKIDAAYGRMFETRKELCGVQAGGKRLKNKRKTRAKNRS